MKIGISGKMASGKTTLAKYLVENHGFVKLSFADPIKELESIQANTPDELLQLELDPIVKDIIAKNGCYTNVGQKRLEMMVWLASVFARYPKMPGEKNRPLLQNLGQEARERFSDSIWIDYALRVASQYDNVVIDDVRYENEAVALKDEGFRVWRVEISLEEQARRLRELYGEEMLAFTAHQSEVDLDNRWDMFDYIIDNNGSLEELYLSATRILKEEGQCLQRPTG